MLNELPIYPAAMPSETLNPNKLAGDYVLGLFLSAARQDFIFIERLEGSKVYQRGATLWCVPPIEHAPPASYSWQEHGRVRSRVIYSAPKSSIINKGELQ